LSVELTAAKYKVDG